MFKAAVLLLLSVFFVGCRYSWVSYPDKLDLSGQFSLPKEEQLKLSYDLINQKVLQPKCVSCHGSSGGVNLESYENVKSWLGDIKRSVFVTSTMPKKNILTDEEKRYLWNWIEIGAPVAAQNPVDQPIEPDPLTATYDSIYKNIFVSKCNTCHSDGNSGERVPLTKAELLDSPLELVLPENPDESGLVIAVERDDYKRMPPAKDGYEALEEQEKVVIRKWIEDGAQ